MTDFIKQLELGSESNGVYQRFIPVFCYIDIPIQVVINKLELIPNKFKNLLDCQSGVIIEWIKSNPDKNFEILDYINFLQTHSQTTRDFIRFSLSSIPGIYVKNSDNNEEFIGLDEDYIKWYNDFASDFDLYMESIQTNIDLRTIPSSKVRPTLKWIEKPYENIKTIFFQTSFHIET